MKFSKLYLSLFCITSPLFAIADTANNTKLDEISVIALRDPSEYARNAVNITTINKQQLNLQQPTSIADALKYIPNVNIAGGSRPLAQKPSIRGLSGNRVVQVIDGVRQNFDLAHRGSYFLPLSFIQDIEVIKGASSTIWGSGALGGVVAIRTPTALDLLRNNDEIGGKIRQGYQSASTLSETEGSVFGATEKLDWIVQTFYNDADNLKIGGNGGKVAYSAYRQTGGQAKVGYQFNDESRLELSHRIIQSHATVPNDNSAETGVASTSTSSLGRTSGSHGMMPRPPVGAGGHSSSHLSRSSSPGGAGAAHSTGGMGTHSGSSTGHGGAGMLGAISADRIPKLVDQKITDQSTVLNYFYNPNSPYINAQITLYRNSTIEKEDQINSSIKDKTRLTTLGINLRNSTETPVVTLTYGLDYYQDKAHTERGTTPYSFRPNGYDATANVIGAYLLGHIPVGSKVVVSPSLRYDTYRSKDKEQRYNDSRLSPSINLTWTALDWLALSARYNQAFRAPSLEEKFTTGYHFGFPMGRMNFENRFIPNPNLKPEIARNKELSAKLHFDNFLIEKDKLFIEGSLFRNDVKDFINLEVFSDNSRIPNRSQYRNITDARLQGFELATQYQTEKVTVGVNYGQVRGKNKDTQQPLENIGADKLGFNLDYVVIPDSVKVGTRITHYFAQNRVPAGKPSYKGYSLTNIYASYVPTSKQWQNLRLDFAIDNLFNKRYLPAFSFTEGSGRNVKLSVGYYF